MLKYFNANQRNFLNKLEKVLEKRKIKQRNQSDVVKKILASVKRNGDKAVIKYEKKFSKIKSNSTKIKFSKKEINSIVKNIDLELKKSIDIAFKRIKKFHLKQKISEDEIKKRVNDAGYNAEKITWIE